MRSKLWNRLAAGRGSGEGILHLNKNRIKEMVRERTDSTSLAKQDKALKKIKNAKYVSTSPSTSTTRNQQDQQEW